MSHYFKKDPQKNFDFISSCINDGYRPNSGPNKRMTISHYFKRPGSEVIGTDDSRDFPATIRGTILWDGPKHAAYNRKVAWLKSYSD